MTQPLPEDAAEFLSLDRGQLVDSLAALTSARGRDGGLTESDTLEFKKQFSDDKRGWVELLKDMVAFHNSKGGIILFGIDDGGVASGISSSLTDYFDPANVTNKLSRYAPTATVATSYTETDTDTGRVGILTIHRGRSLIVFEHGGNYQDKRGKQKAAFIPGVVYTRTQGRCAPARQVDIDRWLQSTIDQQISNRLARIEAVARLPLDTNLIVSSEHLPQQGYILTSGGEGTPVRIVGSDEEDRSVPLSEVLDVDQPYSSLQAQVNQQVRFWKQQDQVHRASAKALAEWYLRRDQIDVDATSAEFLMLSAGYQYAFPQYWASHLSGQRLRDVVAAEARVSRHPFRDVLPYLIATFFWDDRAELFRRYRRRFSEVGRRTANRLAELDREAYLLSGRTQGRSFVFPGETEGERIFVSDLLYNRDLIEEVLERILSLSLQTRIPTTLKFVAHQCDILLGAPDGPL